MGLLSGSRLSDIITALAVFGTRYEEERWLTFLRQAIPGCTELEARWLVSQPSPADSPLPAPQNQKKRQASHSGGSEPRHMPVKRPAAGLHTPVRRSPRYHPTPMTETTVVQSVQNEEAPSPLAASHSSHRPQLSQAFSRLYGTGRHKGILAGLAVLKLYCECLGTTWTGPGNLNSGRDPVVFFRTLAADMADTSPADGSVYQRNLTKTRPRPTHSPNRTRNTQLT